MKSRESILANVQFLRFAAATSVLIGHTQHEAAEQFGPMTPWTPIFWGVGVDIFFVISGFIMFHLAGTHFDEKGYAARFMRRRITRIVPLYWMFSAAMLLSIALFAKQISHTDVDLTRIVTSFFFVPWPRADGAFRPILSLGWTLNYEMLFYLLFTIALLFRRSVALPGLILVFFAASGAHWFVPKNLPFISFWTDPIILLFALGIGIALLRGRGLPIGPATAAALVLGGIAILIIEQSWALQAMLPSRVLATGVPACMICAAAMLFDREPSEGRLRTILLESGNASYALYLCHPFAINALAIFWHHSGVHQPGVFAVAAGLVSILASLAIYRWVEKPLLRLLGGRSASPHTCRAVAAG